MPEKIEIIYGYDGYKDPKIKDVKLNRINGFKTVITKEGGKKMKEHTLKYLTGADAKRILELIDVEGIDIEKMIDSINKIKGVKKMSNEKSDDERFTEEEKKVQEYMAKPENKGVSYRDAVLKVLDRSEPEPEKKEFTEEQIRKRENLKAVSNYILANPGTSWKDGVRVVLRGEELTLEEKLINEYLEKHPGSLYKEAVIESLSLLEKEE